MGQACITGRSVSTKKDDSGAANVAGARRPPKNGRHSRRVKSHSEVGGPLGRPSIQLHEQSELERKTADAFHERFVKLSQTFDTVVNDAAAGGLHRIKLAFSPVPLKEQIGRRLQVDDPDHYMQSEFVAQSAFLDKMKAYLESKGVSVDRKIKRTSHNGHIVKFSMEWADGILQQDDAVAAEAGARRIQVLGIGADRKEEDDEDEDEELETKEQPRRGKLKRGNDGNGGPKRLMRSASTGATEARVLPYWEQRWANEDEERAVKGQLIRKAQIMARVQISEE